MDVGAPIGGSLFRAFALLLFKWRGAFPERNNFPLLGLAWKLDGFNRDIHRLRRCGGEGGLNESFGRVHVLRFVVRRSGIALFAMT